MYRNIIRQDQQHVSSNTYTMLKYLNGCVSVEIYKWVIMVTRSGEGYGPLF